MGDSNTITMSPADVNNLPDASTQQQQQQQQPATSAPTHITMSPADVNGLPSAQLAQPSSQAAQPPSQDLTTPEGFVNANIEGAKGFASELGSLVKSIPSVIYHAIPGTDAVADVSQIPLEYRAYENARAQGKSPLQAMDDVAKAEQAKNKVIDAIGSRLKEFKTNPGSATGKALADLIPVIATLGAAAPAAPETVAETGLTEAGTEGTTEAAGNEAEEPAVPTKTTAPASQTPAPNTPDAVTTPNMVQKAVQSGKNLYQQVTQGADVAQPAAQSAMTSGAEASAEDAGVANDVPALAHNQPIRTLLDEPISALADKESAAYDTLNTAAGTDLKALYDHAEEIQDALDDPTNVSQRAALKEDLQTTQDAITTGEAKATANGVSPDLLNDAKAMTQQRYAMQNLKQKFFNNESVVKGNAEYGSPETIDVNSAIRQAENLNKPSKYAPEGSPTRLQQALGQNGTRKLLQDLYNAQKTGVKAVRVQNIAKLVGKAAGIGSAGLGIHFLSELL